MKKILYILFPIIFWGCSIEYSMLDTSIDAETFSVEIFDERASNAPAGYGAAFTDYLKDFLISRTKLKLVDKDADIELSGSINNYVVNPLAVKDDNPAQNRLTVGINVVCINNKDDKQSFESRFSRFEDYYSSQELSSVESSLLDQINNYLSQDIIDKLTSNW